jgi:hypothetical protein
MQRRRSPKKAFEMLERDHGYRWIESEDGKCKESKRRWFWELNGNGSSHAVVSCLFN